MSNRSNETSNEAFKALLTRHTQLKMCRFADDIGYKAPVLEINFAGTQP